jgi:hypothetical protein
VSVPKTLDELVAGGREYRTPSGLIVIFEQPREPLRGQGWALSPGGLSFPERPGPSLLDQMVVVCSELDLGFAPSTLDETRDLAAQLPFAPAMVVASRFAGELWLIRDEPERQLELARRVFGNAEVVDLFERFLRAGPGNHRYLFHEQQLFVLQRLLVESALAGDQARWSATNDLDLKKALLAASSAISEGSSKLRASGREGKDWLAFLMQNSVYNATEQPDLAYQRAWRMYVELANTQTATEHPAYCELTTWHQDTFGLSLTELFAVAFAAASRAQSPDAQEDEKAIVPDTKQYLSTTTLAERHAEVREALSAPRSFYVDGFARSRNNPLRLAWETTPFMTKPFLRLPGGALCLISPRAAQSFLTDGVYYRFLDISMKKGARDRYTEFVGWLLERYVQEVFEEGLGARPPGSGRVHGEQEYAGKRTSDVVIDYGDDLVLVEVVSTRLPLGIRAESDEAELGKYLERTVTDKLGQLDRVVDDLLDGRARIPDVDIRRVQRIWPVLVTYGELLTAEPLFSYVDAKAQGLLNQAEAQPLTLLGVEDVETLAGMLAAGDELIAVLNEKLQGQYARLPFSRWVLDTRAPLPPRLPALKKRWFDLTDGLVQLLQPPGS